MEYAKPIINLLNPQIDLFDGLYQRKAGAHYETVPLSDETTVQGTEWKHLKEFTMKKGYKTSK